jgi:hypothetical protein
MKVLQQLQQAEGDPKDKEMKAFKDSISNITKFAAQTDKTISAFIKSEESWFYSSLIKLIK